MHSMNVSNNEIILYDTWHQGLLVDSEIDTPWHRFVANQLEQTDLDGKRILEIGCGRGGFACWVARKYGDVYNEYVAADFSPMAIQMGKDHADAIAIDRIKWCVKDIMKIDFPTGYFDIVISCETIEHVKSPIDAVKELYRVLKKEGALILTTPNYGNFMGLYRGWLRLTGRRFTEIGQPINKFVFFSKTKLWLALTGFKITYANSLNLSYVSPFLKREVKINWEKPRWLVKRLGIYSFFICSK